MLQGKDARTFRTAACPGRASAGKGFPGIGARSCPGPRHRAVQRITSDMVGKRRRKPGGCLRRGGEREEGGTVRVGGAPPCGRQRLVAMPRQPASVQGDSSATRNRAAMREWPCRTRPCRPGLSFREQPPLAGTPRRAVSRGRSAGPAAGLALQPGRGCCRLLDGLDHHIYSCLITGRGSSLNASPFPATTSAVRAQEKTEISSPLFVEFLFRKREGGIFDKSI